MLGLLAAIVFLAPSAIVEPDCCDDPKRDCCHPAAQSRSQAVRAYPTALIDRPMILPRWMAQVTAGVGLTSYTPPSGLDDVTAQQTALVSFGADLGLTRRLQVGIYFDLPVYPRAQFETFIADVQIGAARWLNARIDVGVKRVDGFQNVNGDDYPQLGFLAGLGLPMRLKLHRMFALVSGSPSAHGFGVQPMVVRGGRAHYSYYGGGFVHSSDVLALWVTDVYVLGALTLPIGLQFQPIPQLLFGVRTGYRFSFEQDAAGGSHFGHAVPLAFELAATLRLVDVGFTATILGSLDDPYVGPIGWAGAQQYDLHVAGRF
jgi:hypothetical protein